LFNLSLKMSTCTAMKPSQRLYLVCKSFHKS
jgi:hypothetical protein